jgi:hypothetical protein
VRRASYTVPTLALPVLMIICGATARCLTANQAMAADRHSCRYSNQIYDSDASLMRGRAPTHFNLMTNRYLEIVQADRGRACSGTATVAFDGHNYFQAGRSDDPGIAELVPTISSWTGMSLADTFDMIEFAVIVLGILIGYAGFLRLDPNPAARLLGAAAFLCLGLLEAKVADVYIFQISPLIAGIPWLLHFGLTRRLFALNAGAALLAFACAWCSLVRSGTSIVCVAFLIALFVGRIRVQNIVFPLLLILLACGPSLLVERDLTARRDHVLARLGESATAVDSHPIWHSIYAGLGFIPNPEIAGFSDAVARERVRSIDPTAPYTSPRYELLLRQEVLSLAKRRPMLLIENLAVKTAIVSFLALVLLFPARRVLFSEKHLLWLDAAFVLAMGVSAMNVILVAPKAPYLLTFVCLTVLYSLVKLCGAWTDRADETLLRTLDLARHRPLIGFHNDVPGNAAALIVDPSKILADDADRDELNGAQEGDHHDHRRPALHSLSGDQGSDGEGGVQHAECRGKKAEIE